MLRRQTTQLLSRGIAPRSLAINNVKSFSALAQSKSSFVTDTNKSYLNRSTTKFGSINPQISFVRNKSSSPPGNSPGNSVWIDPKAVPDGDTLEKYTNDLTKLAEEDKLDPVIGREKEIRRTLQVLSRRTKNNPVLIGEPGVGKTAIAEGIAHRIVANEVPESIKNKRVLSLDLGALIAGTMYRGEFEERMKKLLEDIKKATNVILFIDELHMLVGAGASQGSMDASNLLKPMLARGELHCIGATTTSEYRKYIEKDAALARRFQSVLVSEPTVDDTISILRGLKEKYEVHHGITFDDSALGAAARLSDRYITDRFLPDKAIDLMDEAASRLRLQQESKPEDIENLDRRIITLKIEEEALKKDTDPDAIARKEKIKEELTQLQKETRELTAQWEKEKATLADAKQAKERLEKAKVEFTTAQRTGNLARAGELKYGLIPDLEQKVRSFSESKMSLLHDSVTKSDIARVVSGTTGIPLSNLMLGERERLLQMESYLKKQVIGQPEAITSISNAVRVSRAGLHPHNRPIGSFLMLGPTGVGKTQLCKSLADFLFDSQSAFIRIDMSEYMEKFSVARLIGAPPGYVGYEEGGTLTEAVRRQPYSLVLFDEFEKAHREVSNILLQMLDDGHLTDSQGRKVDFRNTIIIMTSNLGADILASLPDGTPSSSARSEVMGRVRQAFQPEFINRLDDIIMFNRLSLEHMGDITNLRLNEVQDLLTERKMQLDVTEEAKTALSKMGYDPVYGARPLKRIIQQTIVNPLATYILDGDVVENDTIQARLESNGKIKLYKNEEPLPDVGDLLGTV